MENILFISGKFIILLYLKKNYIVLKSIKDNIWTASRNLILIFHNSFTFFFVSLIMASDHRKKKLQSQHNRSNSGSA